MTTESAVRRIKEMEGYMDEILSAREKGVSVHKSKDLCIKAHALSEYMESGKWLSDYERQEKGEFPKDMKCGILSQDTLYDLLMDLDKEKRGSVRIKTVIAALAVILTVIALATVFTLWA